MLKVNESAFSLAKDQFEICNKVLLKEESSLREMRRDLEQLDGLDDEIIWLGKIISDIEQMEYKMASVIKVLNYSQLQYRGCENHISSNCESIAPIERRYVPIRKITIKTPYFRHISWKEEK